MNATIDAGVVDIVVNLLKLGVLQNDGGQRGIHQRDGVSALTVQVLQDLGPAIGSAGVIGGIARKTRSGNKGDEAGIWFCFRVVVGVSRANGRFGTPEVV